MSNLKVIVSDNDMRQADTEDILRDALKFEYDSICFIGIKDGDVYSSSSNQNSMVETLGMIEVAKRRLLDTW